MRSTESSHAAWSPTRQSLSTWYRYWLKRSSLAKTHGGIWAGPCAAGAGPPLPPPPPPPPPLLGGVVPQPWPEGMHVEGAGGGLNSQASNSPKAQCPSGSISVAGLARAYR